MGKYGSWRAGVCGSIVTDDLTGHDDPNNVEFYGGHLVCESVGHLMQSLILAAPEMLEVLEDWERFWTTVHTSINAHDTAFRSLRCRTQEVVQKALYGDVQPVIVG